VTATLGTKSLNLTGLEESIEAVGPEWYTWENSALKTNKYVYGVKRSWRLSCVEYGVAWGNSAAKYAQDQAAAGNTLALTVNEGDRYQVSNVNVYVLGVEVTLETVGAQNIRRFVLILKEV
jgi:hypothetical protein